MRTFKKIHKYYFEKIYEWAGEVRNVNMAKLDDLDKNPIWFCPFKEIDSRLTGIFEKLKDENHLKGLDADTFSTKAGYYLGEINSIHPFREGNGRTQRTFIKQIAKEAGYTIDWEGITPEQMTQASIEAHKGNSTMLAELIKNNLTIAPLSQEHKTENQLQDKGNLQKTIQQPPRIQKPENPIYENLFNTYSKEVLAETGQKWTDETNRLIAERMLKNKIPPDQVRKALSYSPEKIDNTSAFVKKIANQPEIKTMLKKPKEMER